MGYIKVIRNMIEDANWEDTLIDYVREMVFVN